MTCSRNRDVHSSVVIQESQSISTHSRYDDYVFLTSLVRIYCVDFNSIVHITRADSNQCLDLVQSLLKKPDLRLIRRDDSNSSLQVIKFVVSLGLPESDKQLANEVCLAVILL